MRLILGFALLSILFSVTVVAAQNSQRSILPPLPGQGTFSFLVEYTR